MERDLAQQRVKEDAKDLAQDTKNLIRDRADRAQDRASYMADRAQDKAGDIADQVKDRFVDMKDRLMVLEENLMESTKHAASMADDYVHECPWKSIGIAAGMGLLLGLVIGRR